MGESSQELHSKRIEAVRAWTAFVEHGDDAADAVRPEILRSWQRSGRAITRHVAEAPLADEGETAAFWRELAAAGRGPAGRGRAAAHRRGRRPGHRGDRRRDPDPVDVRRPGDAPQGRVGELRARRAAGTRTASAPTRSTWPSGRARPAMVFSAEHYAADRAQLGVLGRAGARPGDRRAARRHRPVDHLGPHPPDRPGDRPGDGAADRDRDAATPGDRPRPPRRRRPASRGWR